ncbi:hypothetical protein HKBW3S03_02189, partial [Candidatus Hakubella thermalkaliphila]
ANQMKAKDLIPIPKMEEGGNV